MSEPVCVSEIVVEGGGTIQIWGEQVGDNVVLTVKLTEWNDEYNIDLNGLFIDYDKAGGNFKLTVEDESANNLNGLKDEEGDKILWDEAGTLGSEVGGADGDTSNDMGSVTLAGVTLDDLDGALVGIRATSTGTDGEDSLKLLGEIDSCDPSPPGDDFPVRAQEISNVVLYFDAEGITGLDTTGDDGGGPDGFVTVKIDNWDSGDPLDPKDLDASIDDILAYLSAQPGYEGLSADNLLGAAIKGGSEEPTLYYAYGENNTNGTASDEIPEGAPEIQPPPPQGGAVDGTEIDETVDLNLIFPTV